MEPDKIAHLSSEEKKALFMNVTITHPQLKAVHDKILRAIRQPAGFSFVLVHGPTGAGKTTMMESLIEQTKKLFLSAQETPFFPTISLYGMSSTSIPVLRIEADPPDKSAFNRGYFYRTVLTLLGEQTYLRQMHVDIHAEAASPKRRRMTRAATESNDDPDLREGAQAAMYRHGVHVIFLDEAHHLLMARNGTQGSTLQEQLEWLKSLSKTGILYVLVGTYDLFNFGKLNGQIGRRCLPVHFPRYQLEQAADCVAFQAALLELLRRVPLECAAERWVTDHWLYFYECSVGCIGILKDWLLRAVSAALDDGKSRLSLDCVQDYALPMEIYRQMALDAYEGEQRLNHTEVNREHVWRLLQGGELIAPVSPLPPREEPSAQSNMQALHTAQPLGRTEPGDGALEQASEATPPPPIKKTRTRKKADVARVGTADEASGVQAELGEAPPVTPPKRSRKKKTADEASSLVEPTLSESTSSAPHTSVGADARSSLAKPKRTRRVGEPKPKRYPVREQEAEQGV